MNYNNTYLTYTGTADYTHLTAQPYWIIPLIHKHSETLRAGLYSSHFPPVHSHTHKAKPTDVHRQSTRAWAELHWESEGVSHKSTHYHACALTVTSLKLAANIICLHWLFDSEVPSHKKRGSCVHRGHPTPSLPLTSPARGEHTLYHSPMLCTLCVCALRDCGTQTSNLQPVLNPTVWREREGGVAKYEGSK